jgi:hypothetical protein
MKKELPRIRKAIRNLLVMLAIMAWQRVAGFERDAMPSGLPVL